jgi:hypothetical protein
MNIVELEQKVMTALLAGDDYVLTTLRNQYTAASVVNRKFSGVGFFTPNPFRRIFLASRLLIFR